MCPDCPQNQVGVLLNEKGAEAPFLSVGALRASGRGRLGLRLVDLLRRLDVQRHLPDVHGHGAGGKRQPGPRGLVDVHGLPVDVAGAAQRDHRLGEVQHRVRIVGLRLHRQAAVLGGHRQGRDAIAIDRMKRVIAVRGDEGRDLLVPSAISTSILAPPPRKAWYAQDLRRQAQRAGLPISERPAFWPTNPAPASYAIISAQAAVAKGAAGDLAKAKELKKA